MNQQNIDTDISSNDPHEAIKTHKKHIAKLKEQKKLSQDFKKLKRNPLYKKIFDKWFFEDEPVRLTLLHGQINTMEDAGKYAKEQTVKSMEMISLLHEKLRFLEDMEYNCDEGILNQENAIKAIRKYMAEEAAEEAKGDK